MAPSETQTITAPTLLLGDRLERPGWVRISGDRVAQVGGGAPPEPADVTLPDGVLAPGLIDLQLNGAYGHDLASADEAAWLEVLRRLPETGVTSVVPTVTTGPWDGLIDSVGHYRRLRPSLDDGGGARTLGLHLEAVFLAESRRGAHPARWLADPAPERVEEMLAAGGDALAYVTLAPELPGGIAAVERLVAAGVRASVGHSDATAQVVAAAASSGASLVTHLYNAQRPFHHREAGVVGQALVDDRLTVGLIADLVHAGPTAIRLAFAAASARIALVTDAMAAMGMPPGSYDLGGEPVHVRHEGGPVREDGVLAGSVLRLDDAIANTVRCGVPVVEALIAATRTPADALGRGDLGRLAPGAVADLVWLDEDWRARATWVAGARVFGEVSDIGADARAATPRRSEEGR